MIGTRPGRGVPEARGPHSGTVPRRARRHGAGWTGGGANRRSGRSLRVGSDNRRAIEYGFVARDLVVRELPPEDEPGA